MIVVEAQGHEAHDPNTMAPMEGRHYHDVAQRAFELRSAVVALGLPIVAAPDHGLAPVAAVHTGAYLEFLATAWPRWQEAGMTAPAVRPYAAAIRPLNRLPGGIMGQAGYYLAGAGAPILPATWQVSLTSAHAATEAADRILAGAREAYALCRPSGHHAYADLAGGFCYLNNVAIAAQRLLAGGSGPVAILDFDTHHGNGTQGIFYDREDVHFVSVHADPNIIYPFYAGYADETGTGRGAGWNLNLPLAAATADDGFVAAVERGLDAIMRRPPAVLLISLGFDAHAGDPTSNLAATRAGFAAVGQRIGQLGLPTLLVQEGGYIVERLADNLTGFLEGFLPTRTG